MWNLPNSRSSGFEGQYPRFERLAVGPQNAFEQFDLQRPEPFERSGELDLEHAVEAGVLIREVCRWRRLPAIERLVRRVAGANAIPDRRRVEIARELNPQVGAREAVGLVLCWRAEDDLRRRPCRHANRLLLRSGFRRRLRERQAACLGVEPEETAPLLHGATHGQPAAGV